MDAEPSAAGAPRISVVVCTLNGAKRIEKCLAAARRQSLGERLQLIVVDDGSTDNSAEVAAAYGAEVIRHAANRGLAAARNTGIAAARAPIVATLDDDCEPEPEWAERLLGGFVDGVVGVGGSALPASSGGYFGGYLERNNPLGTARDRLGLEHAYHLPVRSLPAPKRACPRRPTSEPSTPLPLPTLHSELAVLRQLGGFDERFRSNEAARTSTSACVSGTNTAPAHSASSLRRSFAITLTPIPVPSSVAVAPTAWERRGCTANGGTCPRRCSRFRCSSWDCSPGRGVAPTVGCRAPPPPVALLDRLPERASATLAGATPRLLREARRGSKPEPGFCRRSMALP